MNENTRHTQYYFSQRKEISQHIYYSFLNYPKKVYTSPGKIVKSFAKAASFNATTSVDLLCKYFEIFQEF